MKELEPIWWHCRNCQQLFKSPVYEPLCGPCAGYPSGGSYRTWESTIIIAIVFALLCWRFW